MSFLAILAVLVALGALYVSINPAAQLGLLAGLVKVRQAVAEAWRRTGEPRR